MQLSFFEFRGIICKNSISVLIRNDVQLLLDKYVLREWRKDVGRPHMQVLTMYDGLVSTTEQAKLVAANEEWSKHQLVWIEFQTNELSKSKCSYLIWSSNWWKPKYYRSETYKEQRSTEKIVQKSPWEMNSNKSKSRKKV